MRINFFFGTIGFVIFLHLARNVGLYIYNLFFGKKRDLTALYGNDTYAFVTGGSEGIGLGIAQQLASKGFNLILVARNEQKLDEAKVQLNKQYPKCQVILRSFDFTTIDNPSTWNVGTALNLDFSKIEVSILVNNVGIGTANGVIKSTEEELINLVKVNCLAQAVMSTYFAGLFRKRSSRSAILNVSSLSALNLFPHFAPYGATKLFNLYVSEGQGNFDDKIDYYCYTPGFVQTRLTGFKTGILFVTPEQSTDFAMRNFGSARHVFAGHIIHEVMALVLSVIPLWALSLLGKAQRLIGK